MPNINNDGEKFNVTLTDEDFKSALRTGNVVVGDVVEAKDGDLLVVKVFDGNDINEFYEEQLQVTPYPVTYRKSVKQLSAQFGTDPSLGGVLMKKEQTATRKSNVFVFVPFDPTL